MKDWTGNTKSVYATLAEYNDSDSEIQCEDYYAT